MAVRELLLATDTEARRWNLTHRPGDLDDRINHLAALGRLAPFCLWPCPPGMNPEDNILEPEVVP